MNKTSDYLCKGMAAGTIYFRDTHAASLSACGIESKSFGSTHVGVHDTAIRNAIAQPSI